MSLGGEKGLLHILSLLVVYIIYLIRISPILRDMSREKGHGLMSMASLQTAELLLTGYLDLHWFGLKLSEPDPRFA
jgi:hypothetical protein